MDKGSGTPNYTPPSDTVGTLFYRVIVNATGNGCDPVISSSAMVEIDLDATISVSSFILRSLYRCNSSINSYSQWWIQYTYCSVANSKEHWSDIAGATGLTYSSTNIDCRNVTLQSKSGGNQFRMQYCLCPPLSPFGFRRCFHIDQHT